MSIEALIKREAPGDSEHDKAYAEALRRTHQYYSMLKRDKLLRAQEVARAVYKLGGPTQAATAACVVIADLLGIYDEIKNIRQVQGTWPARCVQRAFVDGARWWQFFANGSTMFGSEVDAVEKEAVSRYGEPEPDNEERDVKFP